jgi:periodic tryptophan protein 2
LVVEFQFSIWPSKKGRHFYFYLFYFCRETSFTLPFQMQKPVKFICVNPSGSLLFVVDEAGRALLVSLLSHATLSFLKFAEPVTAPPRFSPDGLVLAVAVGRGLEIWRVPDFASQDRQFAPWQLVKRIVQHQANIVNLNWSSDGIPCGSVKRGFVGRWISTASEDMTCRVFKMEYRQVAPVRVVHINSQKAQRKSLEKSADEFESQMIDEEEEGEEDLEAPGAPRKVHVHRPLVISVHRHQPVLATFHISEDDNSDAVYLLTLSKEGTLFAWDFNGENGRLASDRGQKFKIAIDASEDDQKAEDPKHNSVTNISSTSRPERWARLRSVSFRNGKLLVGFTDGIFGLFRIDPQLERVDRLYALSLFNPDTVGDALNPGIGIDTCDLDINGDWLAFGSAKTGQLLVWEWSTESYILRLSGISTRTSSLGLTCSAYSPDGQLLATGGGDGKVRIWRGEGGGSMSSSECVATFTEHVGPITALAFTKQGHVLISASQDGSVRAFDVLRFRAFKLLRPPQPVQFSSLAVDCAGEIVAAGTLDSHEIYLWSLQTGQLVDVFSGHSGPITSLAFEPTRGRLLASGSWDKSVRIWDIYAGPDAKAYGDPFTHETDILSMSFRPDGVELTVATLAGHLVTWSVEGGMILSTIDGRLDIGTKALAGAAFHTICHSADGSCLLAAGSFTAVALYHLPTRTLLKQYPIHLLSGSTASADNNVSGKGLLKPKIDSLAPVARSILFSPTGRSWSVLTPEGLLIYSRDSSLLFDPFDLTPDLSAESVQSALNEGKHLQALIMALRLNIFSVQKGVFEALPTQVFDLIVGQLPAKYLQPFLQMVSNLVDPSQAFPNQPFPLQKLFTALAALFKHHTIAIKAQRNILLPSLRIIQKAVLGHYKDLATLVRDNAFEIDRIILEITSMN